MAVETRNDTINVALHRQVQRARFYTINQLGVQEDSVSAWMQHQIFLTDWLRIEAGLRGDVFFFDGTNKLPSSVTTNANCDPSTDPTCDRNFTAVFIAGNSTDSDRQPEGQPGAHAVAGHRHLPELRQRLSLERCAQRPAGEANPQRGGKHGCGTGPLDRVRVRGAHPAVRSTGRSPRRSGCSTSSSELVFSGDAGNQETGAGGTFEPAGATRRWGIDFETRYQFTNWLFVDYDLSYADPRFRTGEVPGGAIPLAPTLLMNGGLTTEFANGFSAAFRVRYPRRSPGQRGSHADGARLHAARPARHAIAGATSRRSCPS